MTTGDKKYDTPVPFGEALVGQGMIPGLKLIDRYRLWSSKELYREVAAYTGRLAALGLSTGDRLALYSPNRLECLFLLLAGLARGVVVSLLHARLPAHQAIPLAKNLDCRIIVADESLAAPELSEAPGVLSWESFLRLPVQGVSALPENLPASQPATIVWTSGSTGTPKAALHTVGNHYYSAIGSAPCLRFDPGDVWLLSLPLYHVGGLGILFRALFRGAGVYLPPDPKDIGAALAHAPVTHLSLVATQLHRLLQRPETTSRLKSLKAILLGGSAIPTALLRQAFEQRLPVHTSYGLTEMTSHVTATSSGAEWQEWLSSGRVLPHRELRVAADGEILVRGETRFAGYVEGRRLKRPFLPDGWFATGDLGYVDEHDLLHVIGRKDNMFVSGGENVHPEEIERALLALEGVTQAVVVPVPDPEFGHRPVAFVQVRSGPVDAATIRENLAQTLPRYKLPVAVFELPPMALNQGLKIDRHWLARLAHSLLSHRRG